MKCFLLLGTIENELFELECFLSMPRIDHEVEKKKNKQMNKQTN